MKVFQLINLILTSLSNIANAGLKAEKIPVYVEKNRSPFSK